MIRKAEWASSPEEGSSRSSAGGHMARLMPTLTRLRSPPERPPRSWGSGEGLRAEVGMTIGRAQVGSG